MNYTITKNCSSQKDYPVNEQEEQFFSELYNALAPYKFSITLVRMSNGVLAVNCNSYPVGKIKLQGRKHWMQVLKGLYTTKIIEGNTENFIEHIPDWVNYMKKHCH